MTLANDPTTPQPSSEPNFLENVHPAVEQQFAAATDLPTFLASAGKLSLADRQLLVEQALLLLEQTYVHLPLKEAMHGINPIQRLKLLQYRLAQMSEKQMPSEIQFHNEMTDIFTSLRDLHTNYLLPAPFNGKTAFLPFRVEEYFENGQRKYIVSRLASGFSHPTFKPGVEVLYWNGVPIQRAIEINANRQAGSNLAARHARGLEALTTRAMLISLPPDEEWVVVGYRTLDGKQQELKQNWLVFPPQSEKGSVDPNSSTVEATALGIDIETESVRQAKKILFAPEIVAAEQKLAQAAIPLEALAKNIDSIMPGVLRAQTVETPSGTFGYIRIFTFDVDDADKFVEEFVRLAELLPQNGLIIDVRGNGGGLIWASERLLQVLTPRSIEPEPVQFINTPLTYEVCRLHAPSTTFEDFDLSPWVKSIAQAVETGATHSRAVPLTTVESSNAVGQKYCGPVVLITDALCYSATDIFAAGFQDNQVGKILGASDNTGAGGANVWTHELLQLLLNGSIQPFKPLPNGANMRVSIRRTLRVGEQAGTPVEDLGIVPDQRHYMTKDDLLKGNVDLINHAGKMLAQMPVRTLSTKINSNSGGTLTATATTKNIFRLDVFLDGRPQQSLDVTDGTTELTVKLPSQGASVLELRGFDNNRLVATRRTKL
jgi:hypothetical protein